MKAHVVTLLQEAGRDEAKRRGVTMTGDTMLSYELRRTGDVRIYIIEGTGLDAKYAERTLSEGDIGFRAREPNDAWFVRVYDLLRSEVGALFRDFYGPMPPPKGYKKFWRRARMPMWRRTPAST